MIFRSAIETFGRTTALIAVRPGSVFFAYLIELKCADCTESRSEWKWHSTIGLNVIKLCKLKSVV